MGKSTKSMRDEIQQEALKQYSCTLEHLFKRAPEDGILRRRDNKKWFAVFMNVKRETLGLEGEGRVDVMNVKIDPEMTGMLAGTSGYLPAYHMNKEKWLTILLDGTVSRENILGMLDMSYELTGSGGKKTSEQVVTDWLIPANPKYYDIQSEIRKNPDRPFTWKQNANIKAGNTVYMYLAAPVRAVLYKCKVLETDIPYHYEDRNLSIRRAMKLQCVEQYAEDFVPMERLKEHGVYAVRGQRSMPKSLVRELEVNCADKKRKTGRKKQRN